MRALRRLSRVRAGVILRLSILTLCVPLSAQAAINERINAQRSHLHQTHQALSQKRNELHAITVREDQLRQALNETIASIGDVNTRLNVLHGQIASNERKRAWNRIQLHAAQETLQRHNRALRRRLVDAYENGTLGYLQVLFSARSFSEFVERWEDIRLLVDANQRTIRERRAAERRVRDVVAELQLEGNVLDEQNARELRTHEQLASLEETRRNLVAVTEQTRRRTTVAVTELEESSQAQESQLQSMILERQREEELAIEAARAAARRAAELAGVSVPVDSAPGAPGDFSWPVTGPITSPFGMRLDPVSGAFTRMHTGIDIASAEGTTIAAAASGRVIIAGWNDGGYGNMVVVDHGGGLSTLYAHCSQVFVANGQDVKRGQAIAAVGATGHATGPHLHFEVRVNGQPVDPTSRLR